MKVLDIFFTRTKELSSVDEIWESFKHIAVNKNISYEIFIIMLLDHFDNEPVYTNIITENLLPLRIRNEFMNPNKVRGNQRC